MSTPIASADNAGATPASRRYTGMSGRDLLFNLTLLLVCAILVQAVYATVVRPRAEAILAQFTPGATAERANLRSVWVILHEYEPEVVVILTFWSLGLIVQQGISAARNRKLLEKTYINVDENHVVLPEDVRAHSRFLDKLSPEEREMLLPRTLSAALNRFGATRSVQDTAEAINDECDYEASRLDAQLSMVKFTAWAIPAIGFVGTVRGIGRALQDAQSALHGDISGVTLGLGVAFNSTLVALILSIFVMFCLHQLQQIQDRLILNTRSYVTRRLLRMMRVLP